ncbi:DUF397 domain-containing protein [Streptomyces sp. NPDC004959]|uniref:DUF397 domain-containing protein n=1 Tax=unclassified Streptomyces TaxID=2593676 RepID=UPI000997111C|nr:DUF397 domain-containing protein [Streptomyces sp. NRRL F-5630]
MIRQHNHGAWFKSSYSSGQGACIEVSLASESAAFRDSKDPLRPSVKVSRAAWSRFVRESADSR